MDIKDLKNAKDQLQVDLAFIIKDKIDQFYKETGMPIEYINVYIDQTHYIGTLEVVSTVNTSITLDI